MLLFKVADFTKLFKLCSTSHQFSIYFQYASVFVVVLVPFKLKRDYDSTVEGSSWTWLTVQVLLDTTYFHQYGSFFLNLTSAAGISHGEL